MVAVQAKPDRVAEILRGNNIPFEVRDIQHGQQFEFDDGAKLNVYESGKRHWGGPASSERRRTVEEILGTTQFLRSAAAPSSAVNGGTHQYSNRVFIVYGHDTKAREELELMLRRLKLEPVVLSNLPSGGLTIIEKLEACSDVTFACVLLTPDDEGHKAGCESEKKFRARQNVVLELGMFLARLGRKRVAILHKGLLELPSDISGLIYIPFEYRVDEVKERVGAELQDAGFQINIKDLIS